MNEGQLTDLVMERKDIPPMAKIVLRAIIRRVDWKTWTSKEGHKNVSTRELAKRCGTSLPTVIKSIARLEKAGLIERDFFKATKTQAPPIKVNVEAILKGAKESLAGGAKESLAGELKKVKQGAKESLTQGAKESLALSIEDNSNTIKKQYINPSLSLGQECIEISAGNGMANDWGVANVELWGDHLQNDLIINLHNQTDIDTDKE
jgi:DNA-binding transcriptional regulator YhcF (GntR family)